MFVLITPLDDDGLQLQIMAALARCVSEAAERERLCEASDRELWSALQQVLRAPTEAATRAA